MHHLGVAIDYHIGVVRHDDQLPAPLVLSDLPNNQFIDQMVVQIVLGLIEDQRFVTKREQKCEQRRRALTL